MRILVLKFGGASVRDASSFAQVADIIIQKQQDFDGCVVVVSAMANTTDFLIDLARQVNSHPPQREFDMLVSVGERISASLLAMALSKKGYQAISLTGSQSGIITSSDHNNALIVDVKPFRICDALEKGQIVLVAGFQGVSEKKDITTLGRGGSDTSAVALGVALKAVRVDFYKDVDGVYEEDPKKNSSARLYKHLDYEKALSLASGNSFVLHPRCVKLAQTNDLPLNVLSFKNSSSQGTVIANKDDKRPRRKVYEVVNFD